MSMRREASVAVAIVALGLVLAFAAPGFFARDNLGDLFLANLPVLIVALGMTLIILTGEIDISVGSVFAIAGVVAGLLAKAGLPMPLVAVSACLVGAALGGINGALVAYVRIPSIVVTLATMVALRDGLRWATDGAWIQDLPPDFQWLSLTQAAYPFVALGTAVALTLVLAWGLGHLAAGRAVYATGSNREAARLAGLHTAFVSFAVFVVAGGLTGLAALLNSVRFNQIPSNAGLGLELKVIAAVVVGGTSLAGGQGRMFGTLLGALLIAVVQNGMNLMGISSNPQKVVLGLVILAAAVIDRVKQDVGRAS